MIGVPPPAGGPTKTFTRRIALGVGAALATTVVLTAAMLPLRPHLSTATTALVLVVPVVVGVATGGFGAGVISAAGGFLVYDYFFIPPYRTLQVGATENWTALAVYAVVTIPIARLVARLILARTEARQRGEQLRRLLDVSGLLIEDRPLEELLSTVVTALSDLYQARQVALLLPRDGGDLEIAASSGEPLTRTVPLLGRLSSNDAEPFQLALAAAGRPIGLLTISGARITDQQRESLHLFANQAALAVERAQLREQALRAELTDEVGRLASTMVAAVSHDLRTPLAAIKAASSILADPDLAAGVDRDELAALIDAQADRLAGLVTNLLDMGRIQAGVLQPRTSPTSVESLIGDIAPLVKLEIDDGLPLVEVDAMLINRVLVNLLDNAYRHTPKDTTVVVAASLSDPGHVTVSVTDDGPGVSPDRRREIFGFYVRRSNDTGTGLGLAIAKTFIDAHGQRIWVDSGPGGGATFRFTLPVSPLVEG
jgi:two-component system sensor histidine kinase KdpD